MKFKIAGAAIAAATLIASGAQATVNLLTNGSFETGDFTGWTIWGDLSFTGVFSGGVDGDGYAVYSGPIYDNGYYSQTVSDVAGKTYDVSGWASSQGFGYFDISIDGVSFASGGASYQDWTLYAAKFVGTGSDTITITSFNGPAYNFFDDFSISATPEPAAWATMLLGLGFAGAALRRRRALAAA